MSWSLTNLEVTKQTEMVYVSVTLQYIDDLTNKVVSERILSGSVNINRADARGVLKAQLKAEGLKAKDEITKEVEAKTLMADFVDYLKIELGV